ncbi:SCP2 sterol-binding domain-containing protein [Micromonospora zhanjiangensis]
MAERIGQFFAELDRRGAGLLPDKYTGTVLLELTQDDVVERWTLVIDRGRVEVRRDDVEPDCLIRSPRDAFARLLAGRQGCSPPSGATS